MKAGYGAGFAMADHGLTPVEVEAWQGFLFVRLRDDGGFRKNDRGREVGEVRLGRFGRGREGDQGENGGDHPMLPF